MNLKEYLGRTTSLCAFIAAFYLGNSWVWITAGMAGGAFIGFLMAFLSAILMADQVVAGIVLNIFSIGFTSFSHVPSSVQTHRALPALGTSLCQP